MIDLNNFMVSDPLAVSLWIGRKSLEYFGTLLYIQGEDAAYAAVGLPADRPQCEPEISTAIAFNSIALILIAKEDGAC